MRTWENSSGRILSHCQNFRIDSSTYDGYLMSHVPLVSTLYERSVYDADHHDLFIGCSAVVVGVETRHRKED
ncbi:hypothetical protein ABKN59_002484 [Abortiporus biennis]